MKQTNKNRLLHGAAMALCLGLLLLSLCACMGPTTDEDDSTALPEESVAIDTESMYAKACSCYEPVRKAFECGTVKVGNLSTTLYEIKGIDPFQWVMTESGTIYYNVATPLPTLTEFGAVALSVSSSKYSSIELGRLEDADTVRAIAEQFESGESIQKPSSDKSNTPSTRIVRFESEAYAEIYYRLEYLEYPLPVMSGGVNFGRYFLYDADCDRMVAVDEILYDFLNGTDDSVGVRTSKSTGR